MTRRSFFVRIVCSILIVVFGYVVAAETMLYRLN